MKLFRKHTPVAIISVNSDSEFPQGEHSFVNRMLGCKTKQVRGVYAGEEELSYVVPLDKCPLPKVIELAEIRNQESILLLDEYRNAELLFLEDYERVKLGKWSKVPRAVALNSPAYTADLSTGSYYICL